MSVLSYIFRSYPAKFLGCAVLFFIAMFLVKALFQKVFARAEGKGVVMRLVRSKGSFYFQFALFAFYLIASPVVLS